VLTIARGCGGPRRLRELAQDVRDVPVHRVLAENERRRDLAVRQAGGDEPQHLRLAPAERRVAVRLHGRGVVEEPGERPLEVALVVHPRQVGIPAERDEARIRQQRRELAAASDRHGAIAAAVQHESRRHDGRQEGTRVRREVELEKRRGDVR
jgi:hypothetical protein